MVVADAGMGLISASPQVDAEQLGAPLQRRYDRPAQVRSCQVSTATGLVNMFGSESRNAT
jgi:hypothetical protein